MTRKTLNDVSISMTSLFPDNATGLISPADLRSVVQDMLDSLNPAAAMAYGAPNLATSMTATPARLPVAYFPSFFSDAPLVLEGRGSPNGDIIARSVVGQLMLSFDVSFHAPNGIDVNFYLAQNGVVLPPIFRDIGSGAGDFRTVSGSWLLPTIALNDTFTVFAATPGGAASPTIGGCSIKGILLPTLT